MQTFILENATKKNIALLMDFSHQMGLKLIPSTEYKPHTAVKKDSFTPEQLAFKEDMLVKMKEAVAIAEDRKEGMDFDTFLNEL